MNPRRHVAWVIGAVALCSVAAVWTVARGGHANDAVDGGLLLMATGLAAAGGFAVGRLHGSFVPAVVLIAAVVALGFWWDDVWRGVPIGGPFGYANATAAFLAQGAAAGAVLAVVSSATWVRGAALAIGAVLMIAPLVGGSRVMLLFAPALFVALLVGQSRGGRIVVTALAAVGLLAAVVATVFLAGTADDRGGSGVPGVIDDRRVQLWGDALTIIRRYPLEGAGAGSFERLSPTARGDIDAAWAHNEFLQFGAELGLVGLAVLALVFVWSFVGLGSASFSPAAAPAAVALLFLGLQSSIDYVLHFAAVPLACAALVGSAIATRDLGREAHGT